MRNSISRKWILVNFVNRSTYVTKLDKWKVELISWKKQVIDKSFMTMVDFCEKERVGLAELQVTIAAIFKSTPHQMKRCSKICLFFKTWTRHTHYTKFKVKTEVKWILVGLSVWLEVVWIELERECVRNTHSKLNTSNRISPARENQFQRFM